MFKKNIMLLLSGLAIVISNISYAELPGLNSNIKLNPKNIKARPNLGNIAPRPKLNLKADLIIQSMGYSAEFCTNTCSDQWSRELQTERISAETCYFSVTVKNIGSASSRPGKVQVNYDSLGGNVKMTGNMPSIRAGQFANVTVPFNNSRMTYLYRKFRSPFKAKVDSTNTTVESNEGNNTKSVLIR